MALASSRRPRVADVAAHAGVSVGTVSNVLNRRTTVSPAIRDRVQAAIDELGFVPNAAAKSLRQGFSPALGVLIPDLSSPSTSALVNGIQERLSQDNMTVMLCSSEGDSEREARFLRLFAEQRVVGVLATPSHGVDINLQPLRDRGVGVLLMDSLEAPADDISCLGVDDVAGARTAVEHLIAQGRTRLCLLNGPDELTHCGYRLQGAREAVAAAGLPREALEVVRLRNTTADEGRRGAQQVFGRGGEVPDGLFCVNDLVALGAMRELRRLGLSIPDDVAVVGYEDAVFSPDLQIPLSSVTQPMHEMGWKAADLMVTATFGRQVFQPQLVVRASSSDR